MNTDSPSISARYTVGERLGSGGMGIVYRAFDRLTQKPVALKRILIKPDLVQHNSASSEPLLSLATEFHTLASLRHPHIVPVLDYGFDVSHAPYYTMTLLEDARSLTDYGRTLDDSGKVRLLVELLQALVYLHRRGIIHRDLKPQNILITPDARLWVLDFGLAMTPDTSTPSDDSATGTLPYMAPELFMNTPASEASDLYAVGVMLFELWANCHPFASQNGSFVLMDALMRPADVSPLPPVLAPLAARLLGKTPEGRPARAEFVIDDLCEAMDMPLPIESLTLRESFLQASAFVGRESEMATLRGTLSDVLVGGTAFWLVGGESGVGKSRLIDELRTRALIEGAVVLRGQAVAEGGLPYQMWREIARRLALDTTLSEMEASVLKTLAPDVNDLIDRDVPDAPELPGSAGQNRLIFTLVEVLKRQTQPVVLLLEDLQWSDESLAPLRQLLLVRDQLRQLLVVGTYRDDERPKLPDELSGMPVLKLHRFDDAAVLALARGMLGEVGEQAQLVQLLHRETEGNVFFMVEMVRVLAENAGSLAAIGSISLPATILAGGVQRIVQRRLDQLPEAYQPLLRWAAVVGRQLDVAVLTHLTDAATVNAFVMAGANTSLFELTDNVWRFAHDKLREGALHSLPTDDVAALHRAVAEALEATYPADPAYYEALRGHWRGAGNVDREVHYLLLVVELLETRAAYDEAKSLVTHGLALLGDRDDVRIATLLKWRATIAHSQGDYTAAWQEGQTAFAQAQRWGVPAEIAATLRLLGLVSINQGNYTVAHDYFQQSLDSYRNLNDQRGIARTLSSLGMGNYSQGNTAAARDYYQQSLVLSRVIGDQRLISTNLTNLGNIYYNHRDYIAARDSYQQSLVLARAIGDQRLISINLINLGGMAQEQSDFAAAQDNYEQGLALFHAIGDQRGIAICLLNLGIMAANQDHFTTAQDYYEQSLTLSRAIGDQSSISTCLYNLGEIAHRQGNFAAAQAYYEQSLTLFRTIGDQLGAATCLCNIASLYFEKGAADLLPTLREGLNIGLSISADPVLLKILVTVARWAAPKRPTEAVRLAGLIEVHSATDAEIRKTLSKLLLESKSLLPDESFSVLRAEGAKLDLEATAREWLVRLDTAI